MKHEPGIAPRASRQPTIDDFKRARATYAAGEGVDHVIVGQWLLTWGDDDQKPFAEWLQEQHG